MKSFFAKLDPRALRSKRRDKRRNLRGQNALRHIGLSLEPLEERRVLTAGSESEANNTFGTANPVPAFNPAVVMSGAIGVVGDVDFFSFSATAGQRIWSLVDTGSPPAATGASRDSVLEFRDTDGTTMIESDDDDGVGNGGDATDESGALGGSAIAGRSVVNTGTNFMHVREFGNNATINPYKMFLVTTSAANQVSEIESNNTSGVADAFSSTTFVRTASIGAVGDVDFYGFNANAGDVMFISADADPERNGGTDLVVELRDTNGTTVLFTANKSTTGSGAAESFNFAVPATGTYFVRVNESGNDATGTYDLMVANTTAVPGALVYNASTNPGITAYTLRQSGAFIQVVETANPSNVLASRVGVFTTAVNINGQAGVGDELTVSFAGGNPLPVTGPNTFDAGASLGDSMVLTGGAFNTIRHFFTNATDGSVEFDDDATDNGGSTEFAIAYTGLDPIADNMSAVNRVFTYAGTPDVITLQNDVTQPPTFTLGFSEIIADNGEAVRFANPTTSITVNGAGGADTITVNDLDPAITLTTLTINGDDGNDIINLNLTDPLAAATTVNLNGGADNDEIRVGSTLAAATTNVNVGGTIPDRVVVGRNTLTGLATTFAEFNTGTSTLDGILGTVNVDASPIGVGELYVDDSGDADADAVTFTGSSIVGAAPATINYDADPNGEIETVQLALGTGADTIDVQDTAAPDNVPADGTGTLIFGNAGNDTFTIDGDDLSGINVFQGGDDNDQFILNIAANIGATATFTVTSVQIQGNDGAGGNPSDSANRDRVTINDNSGTARFLNYQYTDSTSGDVDIQPVFAGTGLFGALDLDLQIRTTETVIFNDPTNNDFVNVTGTTDDDLLTVALLANNTSALVFRGGAPYESTPPVTIADSRPGVAGGGTGPDLLINGIFPGAGIFLSGGGSTGTGDRAIVYAASEDDLVDVGNATDIFGFGAGILQPGFGAGNAYDTIAVTDALVTTTNNAFGALTPVILNTPSFVQTGPPATQAAGLTVNGGDEAGPNPASAGGDIADDFTATVSSNFFIQINGNLPTLTFDGAGNRQGDQLVITPVVGPINVFSDKASPPNVTITSGAGPFGIRNTSIERLTLDAGPGGVVNLIGDNGNFDSPNDDQPDNFVVRGRDIDPPSLDAGFQEFTLEINGSPPIAFDNVQYLNVLGHDGIDTLDIAAWADNSGPPTGTTPRGWGIEVNYDEALPDQTDGDQVDLLIYNTVLFGGNVSENIIIQPSAIEGGEIRATNATDGSAIVTISYINNLDIIVLDDDGFLSDTDTLTLRGSNPDPANGLSGHEIITANFTAAGDVANPMVTVADQNSGLLIYRLRNFTNFNTINFETLAGDDTVSVIGRDDGSLVVNVNGGPPSASDTLALPGTAAGDMFTITPGASSDSGAAVVQNSTATAPTTINFTGTEAININGRGGPTTVAEVEPNDTIATAQDIDAENFSLVSDPRISDSTTIPHISIAGTGDGSFDYYSFTIANAGDRAIFDMDGTNFDTELFLYDTAGNLLAENDDIDDIPLPTDTGSNSGLDSFLEFTFPAAGTFVIGVGKFNSAGDPGGITGSTPDPGEFYTLNISIENHAIAPASVGGDVITLFGTGGPNAFTLEGTGTLAGTARVDANPFITFNELGADLSAIDLVGLGGDDSFSVAHVTNWQIPFVVVEGGPPSASDSFQLSGTDVNDDFTYTASASNAGSIDLTSGGSTTNYLLVDVESARINGRDQDTTPPGDTLIVPTDNAVITPGFAPGTGTVQPFDAIGAPLLPLIYAGIETAAATGTTVVIDGTSADDIITVSAAGIVTVTNTLGFTNSVDVSVYNALVINSLGGDDRITINASALFAGGVTVIGGDNGTGSDDLTVVGTAGDDTITVNLATSVVTGVVGGPINFTGIENLTVNGGGTATGDDVDVTNFGAVTGLEKLFINLNNNAGDTLDVDGTAGNDTINFDPIDVNSGKITRDGTPTQILYTAADPAAVLRVLDTLGGFDVLNVLGTAGPDTVTSTASTITRTGTVTFGPGMDRLDVTALAGDDTVTLTAFTGGPTIVYGGDGNDTILGSGQADIIFGGPGNDVLVGGAGNDTQYGEDGNDIFGNPTLASNGVADDAGTDFNFGGPGFDNFVWEPGDGPDFNNGGEDGADIFRFFGDANANVFLLTTGGTPTHFNALIGAVNIDNHGIEDIVVDGQGGADTFTVNDLYVTEVKTINLNLGAADAAADAVTVNGRPLNDNIFVSTPGAGAARIAGLRYDVNVTNAGAGDTLTVNGNDGDDVMTVGAGVNAVIPVTLNGNEGNDTTQGATTENGGNGDDRLSGTTGNDTLNGGAGNDTYIPLGGTDTVTDASGNDVILMQGTAGNDTFLVTLAAGGANLQVTINGVTTTYPAIAAAATGLDRIIVNGIEGNDTLTVNSANGAVPLTTEFNGGGGNDLVILTGGTATSDIYSPGPNPGQGVSSITIGAVTQVVTFTHIEPVIDLVAGPLVVNGSPANNAINYTIGPNSNTAVVGGAGVTSGLVSVDNFETIEFANKTTLVINGLAGSDTINLNHPSNPTGLTGIGVNAGDPTGTSTNTDRVIVNGQAGANAITVAYGSVAIIPSTPPTNDEARVTGAQAVPVDIDQAELLVIDGQGGGDSLSIVPGTFTLDTMTLTPGPDRDSGNVLANTTGGQSLLPIDYLDLDGATVAAALPPAAQPNTANTITLGTANTLVYNGTTASDVFYVDAAGNVTLFSTPGGYVTVNPNVTNLRLNGLAGDDTFNIYATQPYTTVLVNGGEPSASDVMNLIGAAGADAIAVNFFASPPALPLVQGFPVPVTVTGLGGTIGITGTEHVNIDGNGGADTLTVNGSALDDTITYTPTNTDATVPQDEGIFTNEGFNTTFTFNRITGAFTINGGSDLADHVIVRGTNSHDFMTVNSPTRTVSVENALGNALKPVVLGATVEEVTAASLFGNDTILVIPAPATLTGVGGGPVGSVVPLNLLIHVDGGPPSASDALVIAQAGGAALPASDFVVVNRSRTPDEGVIRVFRNGVAMPDIDYINTEVVSPILPAVVNPAQDPNLLILGPDNYEQNEFLSTASFLGSASTINVSNLAIFPNALEHRFVLPDQDWFRVVAQKTGTMDFQVYFRGFNAAGAGSIPGGGNLGLEAYDVDGTRIDNNVGVPAGNFGANENTALDANERIRIPVVAGQTYYLRVFGGAAFDSLSNVVNGYNLTVINEAPPTPFDLEIDDTVEEGSVISLTINNTTTTFQGSANLSSIDDFYTDPDPTRGKVITFTSPNNPLTLERARIIDYDGATRTFTLATPLSSVPTLGTTFQIESIDTGRNQFDNHTRDNTPTIYFRLDDAIFLHDLPGNDVDDTPPDQVTVIPFRAGPTQPTQPGYAIAIFDEGPTNPNPPGPNQPPTAPQTPIGFATKVPGFDGVYAFTTPALGQGSHFLSARVQMIDPSNTDGAPGVPGVQPMTGFGPRSLSLEVVVDISPPPVYFGLPAVDNDGLDASSDSGVVLQPNLFIDRITNDNTPTFFGTAEANSVIRLYADLNNNAMIDSGDVLIGQTVATPFDGTNQFPGGRWVVTTNVNLNDPTYFPIPDGIRRIMVSAEDVAGNESSATLPATLEIFLDTTGPRVEDVFTIVDPNYELFDPKPSTAGPTPLINSIDITFLDLPPRAAGGGGGGTNMIDVFVLFDDTGSFSGVAPSVIAAFPTIISTLQATLPGSDLAFGVGRFEDYAGVGGGPSDRPFILNQPILDTDDPQFTAAINAALARSAPGGGGDGSESAIEGLFQAATGAGFDGNNDGDTTDSGDAGLVLTQTTPGAGGDVPAFGSFTADPTGPTVNPSGNLGGVGFRAGAAHIILLATDIGFAFEPDALDPYVGIGGVTVPAASLQIGGRGTTPNNAGASIQDTINALLAQNIRVVGLGDSANAGSDPRLPLESLAILTGATNTSAAPVDSGIVGDPIAPGEPLYFLIDPSSGANIANAIAAAVGAAAPGGGFSYPAVNEIVAETIGNYQVVGDHTGNALITNAEVINTVFGPDGVRTTVRLTFNDFLPDDRFTLHIRDSIVDDAGNRLDGESQAASPFEESTQQDVIFPSGDGVPGGGFFARFTVDSRPEIGTYAGARVSIDINGNLVWDPEGQDNDATNRDLQFTLGVVAGFGVSPMNIHDAVFAGNFDSEILGASGFDKLAAYGNDPLAGGFRWLIDVNHDGVVDPAAGDIVSIQPAGFQINGIPIAGDFDPSSPGDEIGLYTGTLFYLDTNGDDVINGLDAVISTELRGLPLVGDFDGDGFDDLATWKNDFFNFDLDLDGFSDGIILFGFPGVGEKPIVADMDQDGIDDVGLFVPGRSTVTPPERGEWYFLISNDFPDPVTGATTRVQFDVNTLRHRFSPIPLGQDLFAHFGDEFALPLVGNFDPPVTHSGGSNLGVVHMPKTAANQNVSGAQSFNFQTMRGGTVSVDVQGSSAAGLSVQLLNSSHQVVASGTTNSHGQAVIQHPMAAAGSGMIRVAGNSANVTVNVSNQISDNDLLDVNRDGHVSGIDLVTMVASLNGPGARALSMSAASDGSIYHDTNQDGYVSGFDLLRIVERLNTSPAPSSLVAPSSSSLSSVAFAASLAASSSASSAPSSAAPAASSAAADSVFASIADDEAYEAPDASSPRGLVIDGFDDSDASDPTVEDLDLDWVA